TATDGTATGTAKLTVNPGDASAVVFVPATTSAMVSGSKRTFTARIQDTYGNTITGYTGTVTFTQSAGPGSVNGLPAGPVSVSGGDGTTGMLTANLVGNVTIRAQSGALTTSTSFPVVAAATTTALDAPPSVQYSDLLALTATVTPANLGNGQM